MFANIYTFLPKLPQQFFEWLDYMQTNYIGRSVRDTRRAPRIPILRWSQYNTIMEGGVNTTNSVEAFNGCVVVYYITEPYNTLQYAIIKYRTLEYSIVQYNTLHNNTINYGII